MATIKMKKDDQICNINDSSESITHARLMGFIPINNEQGKTAEKPAEIKPDAEQPEGSVTQSRRGRPPKSEAEAGSECPGT